MVSTLLPFCFRGFFGLEIFFRFGTFTSHLAKNSPRTCAISKTKSPFKEDDHDVVYIIRRRRVILRDMEDKVPCSQEDGCLAFSLLFSFSLFFIFFLLYKTYYAAKNCDQFSMPVGMKVETTNTMMRVDLRCLGLSKADVLRDKDIFYTLDARMLACLTLVCLSRCW